MTTAPDLPYASRVDAALLPDQVELERPTLTLVPSRAGEELDFDAALRRAVPRLTRYAARRLHDPHEAEEVVQEAMLRAFQHRESLVSEDDLMAWLTVVTGRLVIDRLRVRGRFTPVAEMPVGSRASRDTADVVVARDEARLALDALEAMPARQAAVLWAREIEGMSYDEIGDRFGMSEPAVRSVLHRARRTLRREYAVRGGTLPAVGLVALAPWLRGMRAASKLRDLVRRTGSAAVVAATGLAAITVAPWLGQHAPVQAAPPMRPALGTMAAPRAAHHAVKPAHTVRPAAVSSVSLPSAHGTLTPVRHVPCVQQNGANVGCEKPQSPTLYVHLPVKVLGQRWIGVSPSTGNEVIDKQACESTPTTPVTECDTTTQRS